MELKQSLLAGVGVVAAAVSAVFVVATVSDSGAVQQSDVVVVESTQPNEHYLALNDRFDNHPLAGLYWSEIQLDLAESHLLTTVSVAESQSRDSLRLGAICGIVAGQIRQWRSVAALRHIIAQPGDIDIVRHDTRELLGTCGIGIDTLTTGLHTYGGT